MQPTSRRPGTSSARGSSPRGSSAPSMSGRSVYLPYSFGYPSRNSPRATTLPYSIWSLPSMTRRRSQSSTGWLMPSTKPKASTPSSGAGGGVESTWNAAFQGSRITRPRPGVEQSELRIEQDEDVRDPAGPSPLPAGRRAGAHVPQPARAALLAGDAGDELGGESRDDRRRDRQRLEPLVGEGHLQRRPGPRPGADGGRDGRRPQPRAGRPGIGDAEEEEAGLGHVAVAVAHQALHVAEVHRRRRRHRRASIRGGAAIPGPRRPSSTAAPGRRGCGCCAGARRR